jgi:hypothetical protein
MFNLIRHGVLIDEIVMFGKTVLMVIFLPVIAVLTCLLVVFLRVIDGAACLLDVLKVRTRIPRHDKGAKK